MATYQIPLSFLSNSYLQSSHLFFPFSLTVLHKNPNSNPSNQLNSSHLIPISALKLQQSRQTVVSSTVSAINGDNGVVEPPKPSRRGRKKVTDTSSDASTTKKPKRSKKPEVVNGVVDLKNNTNEETLEDKEEEEEVLGLGLGEEDDYDDGIDFPYDNPPLICCFGAAQKEFVPSIRISNRRRHPDIYSEWKQLQWDPPEFVRAPGGPPSNVAISHVRLGGRAAFMGKVGDDEFGEELVYTMNKENVQTRAVKFDSRARTGATFMKIKFEDGKMKADIVRESAENSLSSSELNISVLKEARIFHFNSEVLISPSMKSALYKAIALSKKFGGLIFFDLNLPLPLWKSRDETKKAIKKAWNEADIIEVTKQELEFLLDEDHYERRRNYKPQYYSETFEQTKNRRDYYHYTRDEISPLWHDKIKLLFVTDGTLRIHYYAPSFDGVIVGTEDVLITPFTCDRTGSGDAIVAAIMRKLTTNPEMFENQDVLERQLRFAVAAGIISQWTIGAVRGFPTESATQNLKEQVYVPSMW